MRLPTAPPQRRATPRRDGGTGKATRTTHGENVEVGGSHSGLAHNRAVYPHLARFLAS